MLESKAKPSLPYLNLTGAAFGGVEDDVIHITLQKRDKGNNTWSSPILGQGQLDPLTSNLEQKRLMLQRFQEENPGFDFSQAQFNGTCPDPRTFLGGIRTDRQSPLDELVAREVAVWRVIDI